MTDLESSRQSYKNYLEYGSNVIRDSSLFSSEMDFSEKPKHYSETEGTRVEIKPPIVSEGTQSSQIDRNSQNDRSQSEEAEDVGLNAKWLKRLPPYNGAVLKVLMLVFGLATMTCGSIIPKTHHFGLLFLHSHTVPECDNGAARDWFLFVAVTSWLTTFFFFICFLFNIHKAFNCCPWEPVEIAHNFIWGGLYLIASFVHYGTFHNCTIYIIAAVFADICGLLYIFAGVSSCLFDKEKTGDNS